MAWAAPTFDQHFILSLLASRHKPLPTVGITFFPYPPEPG